MNSPFVLEQARAVARRPEIQNADSPEARIRAAYEIIFQRDPEPKELELGEKFLTAQSGHESHGTCSPLEMYTQVLLLSNELMFVD